MNIIAILHHFLVLIVATHADNQHGHGHLRVLGKAGKGVKETSVPSGSPSFVPSNVPSIVPSSSPSYGPTPCVGVPTLEMASPDSLGAPRCQGFVSSCNSGTSLSGRGNMISGTEQNQPNTIDSCVDGHSGENGKSPSIENFFVRSGNEVESSACPLTEYGTATIIAHVYTFTCSVDSVAQPVAADFYYANDATAASVTWYHIGTIETNGGGDCGTAVMETLYMEYTIPQVIESAGVLKPQAVRVNLRWGGSTPANACGGGVNNSNFDDKDDLIIAVKQA